MTNHHDVAAFHYFAFISYSHKDKACADWLHKALERYAVPARLVGQVTPAGTIPKRLTPIFRDREELASAHDLNHKVNAALAQSANLIVICSPHSATSRWVDAEIARFQQLGRQQRIFCLIVDGEPNASDLPGREAEECFAPSLRFQRDTSDESSIHHTEPIAADLRPDKDGKSSAKLKLIAGLLDVGFDAIRQRELQRRTRRLAWIAGFGVLGMAVMSVLAGMAVHERNRALMQREQAEDLVGFMLGNLRDKLEAVSRLDILDDVADHALTYFETQPDVGGIESRTKRAEAFLLLGRVRLDQGRYDEAARAFNESLTLVQTLTNAGVHTPALDLTVIDTQFWLGTSLWQQGKAEQALGHFQRALPLLTALTRAQPENEQALRRLAWMHTNVGHVLESQSADVKAMAEYRAEFEVSQQLVKRHPQERSYQRELAAAYDNIAALLYAEGDIDGAEKHYGGERDVLAKLVTDDPRDDDTRGQLAVAQTFLAQVAEALGHGEVARDSLRGAMTIGEAALIDNPDNIIALGRVASYCRRLGRNQRLAGDTAAATTLLTRSDKLYRQMLAQSPDNVRAQYGLAATRLEQAALTWQTGDIELALDRVQQASSAFAALLHAQNYETDASLGVAGSLLLAGKIDSAIGNAAAAQNKWTQALDALHVFDAGSHDPDQLNVHAELLTRLGRDDEARPMIARLNAMHYRDPAFVAWRRTTTPSSISASVAPAKRD